MYVNPKFANMNTIQSKNPYNGVVLDSYTKDTKSTIHSKLKKAVVIGTSWGSLPVEERCKLLSKVADLLLERKEEYAELNAPGPVISMP